MPLDPLTFRQTMGQFPTGVTVIAAQVGDEIHGMTANAVTSLSLDPMLVIFCAGKQTRMAELIRQAASFSINILRDEQQALSSYFAGAWKEPAPPFRFVPWTGGPRVEGCLAAIGCEVHEFVEGGDHWIVIGRVLALHQGIEPRRPLVFYARQYWRIDVADSQPAPNLGWVETPTHVFYDPWQSE